MTQPFNDPDIKGTTNEDNPVSCDDMRVAAASVTEAYQSPVRVKSWTPEL